MFKIIAKCIFQQCSMFFGKLHGNKKNLEIIWFSKCSQNSRKEKTDLELSGKRWEWFCWWWSLGTRSLPRRRALLLRSGVPTDPIREREWRGSVCPSCSSPRSSPSRWCPADASKKPGRERQSDIFKPLDNLDI